MTQRDCLLCGAMICGCAEHRSQHSVKTIYGLCDTCAQGTAIRCGERSGPRQDELTTKKYQRAPVATVEYVRAYLDSLQRERAS